MKPEEILDRRHCIRTGNLDGTTQYYNRFSALAAMTEYASLVSKEKDRVHTESISTLLDLHKKELAKNYGRIADLEAKLAQAIDFQKKSL